MIADISKGTVESTTVYPMAPRPRELRGVERITYADYNLRTSNDKVILDGQVLISLRFSGDGDKPWSLGAVSDHYVHGVRGKHVELDTGWRMEGFVSNEEVLSLWRKLEEIGIPMPSWRDGPNTDVGRRWDWFYQTDRSGQRVYTRRDEEYYTMARTMERPLSVEFRHEPRGVESQCEWFVNRDSDQWRTIADIFLKYCEAKRNDPNIERADSRFVTQGDDQPCVVATLTELLAHPAKYHGKRVRVTGYHHSEFEHSRISSGPDSVRKYSESLWFGGTSRFANPNDVAAHNDAFITVEGTFTDERGGHTGLWAGAIERITKIEKRTTEELVPATPSKNRSGATSDVR